MSKPPKDKPKVDLACQATRFDAFNERTIYFSHPNGAGLITFRALPDGTLAVDVHDQDPTVACTVMMKGPYLRGGPGGRK